MSNPARHRVECANRSRSRSRVSALVVPLVIRGSIDRRNSGPRPNGGWHARFGESRESANRHGKPTCERLAAQTRCSCGRVRPGLRRLCISRTISSRSNLTAARFNRVALRTQLNADQKIDENQRLVIIARLDPCPWGVGVSTNPAVAVAPSADHLDSQIRITLEAQTLLSLRLARLTDAGHDSGLIGLTPSRTRCGHVWPARA